MSNACLPFLAGRFFIQTFPLSFLIASSSLLQDKANISTNPAPPRLQRGVYDFEFVTHHPISIKICIIHLVPALSSEDMF